MLWVYTYVVGTQKTVSTRRFFEHPKHMLKIKGKKTYAKN